MNLAYFDLTDHLDDVKRAEIDRLLAPPELKEKLIDRQNAAAQRQLASMGLLPPPPPRKKKEA